MKVRVRVWAGVRAKVRFRIRFRFRFRGSGRVGWVGGAVVVLGEQARRAAHRDREGAEHLVRVRSRG